MGTIVNWALPSLHYAYSVFNFYLERITRGVAPNIKMRFFGFPLLSWNSFSLLRGQLEVNQTLTEGSLSALILNL